MKEQTVFAASGSCFAKEKIVYGITTDDRTFTSDEFEGRMDSQKFWDDLAAYAKKTNRYVKLVVSQREICTLLVFITGNVASDYLRRCNL